MSQVAGGRDDGVRTAVCPGSFDPVTLGHLDVISRASRLFDRVVVAVGVNQSKQRLFGPEERLEMLTEALAPHANVEVAGFDGLLTDFCREQGAQAVVKGVRSGADVEYEFAMAQMNAHLTGVDTVFLPTSPAWSFVSSSLVKEVARLGGDVSALVPAPVLERLAARLSGA